MTSWRPGIAVTLDLTGHPVTLLDMGANISPKPLHLRQYGRMGAIYVADTFRALTDTKRGKVSLQIRCNTDGKYTSRGTIRVFLTKGAADGKTLRLELAPAPDGVDLSAAETLRPATKEDTVITA